MPNISYRIRTNKKAYLEPLPPYVREIFCRFLKQNHVYTQFFTKNIQTSPPLYMHHSFRTLKPYDALVTMAFTWSSTKEGWDFWSDIHTKWVHICRQGYNDPTISILIKSLLA